MLAGRSIDVEGENDAQRIGIDIVRRVCSTPFEAIISNAGKSPEAIMDKVDIKAGIDDNPNTGYDARNNVVCDMFLAGIIDPTKVTRTALELATSVTGTLLTTECVISLEPETKEKENQPQYEY